MNGVVFFILGCFELLIAVCLFLERTRYRPITKLETTPLGFAIRAVLVIAAMIIGIVMIHYLLGLMSALL